MRGRFIVASALCSLALLSTVSPARADHAEAVRLFDEGKKQRDAGEYEKALHTFERSLAEEKSIGAYFNLGIVLEQLGRYREAYDTFQIGKDLASSKGDEREKDLREAMSKLLDTRNHIALTVPGDVKSAEGVRIVVDNIEVPPKQYDGYVFRAPAQHEIVVRARGRKDMHIQAKNRQFVAVSLGEPGANPAPVVVPVPPPGGEGPPPEKPTDSGPGWPTKKVAGFVLMGAGVAAGAIGLGFNIAFLSEKSRVQDEYASACRGNAAAPLQCGSPALPGGGGDNEAAKVVRKDAIDNDERASIVLPIAYVSAALLFGAGLYFFLTADDKKADSTAARVTVTPRVGPRDGGLSVVGTF